MRQLTKRKQENQWIGQIHYIMSYIRYDFMFGLTKRNWPLFQFYRVDSQRIYSIDFETLSKQA